MSKKGLEGLESLKEGIANKFPSPGGVPERRGGRNSHNYFNLPFNPKLKLRAKQLRQAGNLSEVLFWNQVKNKQFKGFDFDRQKIIGNYIVDFYCSNCNVVLEIDGSSHDNKQVYDAKRDIFLQSLGLVVIHIAVAEIMSQMSGVMEMLFNHPALQEPLIYHPALKTTPPVERNKPPRSSTTPPVEGNKPPWSSTTPPVEGNKPPWSSTTPPEEGNKPPWSSTTPPEEGNKPPWSSTTPPEGDEK